MHIEILKWRMNFFKMLEITNAETRITFHKSFWKAILKFRNFRLLHVQHKLTVEREGDWIPERKTLILMLHKKEDIISHIWSKPNKKYKLDWSFDFLLYKTLDEDLVFRNLISFLISFLISYVGYLIRNWLLIYSMPSISM
jgi:hypothetical protein